jgi:cell division protein FtsL
VARARHEARTQFVELERLSAERDELNIEFNKLQLEQSTWSNHGFVERTASKQKSMYLPRPDEIEFVTP